MKKIMIYILSILVIIILGVVMMTLLNPLRKSEKGIRKDILKLTPMGSSMEEVIRIIESNEKWKNMYVNHEYPSEHTNLNNDTIIGAKSIKVLAGKYNTILDTYVEIYWGFDENEKLIEIGIRKTKDTL